MRLLKTFFLILFFFALSVKGSFAAESIQSFESEILAHQDGTMDITETIRYDFGESQKRGIFREIPKVSKVGDLYRVIEVKFENTLRNGQPEIYTISESEETLTVRIGNPDRTITGLHTYVLSYKVKNGIGSNYEDHDEIYWNVTGNGWTVSIFNATATITTDFGVPANQTICFTGILGSTDKNCQVSGSTAQVTKTLSPSEGLTIVSSFPVGTFPKSILREDNSQETLTGISDTPNPQTLLTIFLGLWGVLNIVLPLILVAWYLRYKRKERLGPPAVNFDIPHDETGKIRLTPAEAGTIDTAVLERDDVLATIFDLAIRKYLKIEQIKESSKFLGLIETSKEDFVIKKLKDYGDLSGFEKALLDRLFEEGDKVNVSNLKSDFYQTFNRMGDEIFKSLVAKGYYSKNPKNQRNLLLALGITAIVIGSFILGGLLLWFSHKLNGRTALGDQLDWRIDGLKLFLKNMSRNYKWQAEQLYIVEKMIPYALALGYIEPFMRELQIIKPDYKPTWYSGNMAFYSISDSMFSSMNSSFTMAVKYKEVFLQMVTENQTAFNEFKKVHDQYASDPAKWQNELNKIGSDIQDIIRRYENRLCGKTESSSYGKYSAGLSEKFQEEIRQAFPKVDCIGLTPPKFEIKKINLS